MNKIIIARKPCGCIVAAALDDSYPELGQDVLDWLRQGYVVKYEERNTVGFERCASHEFPGERKR